MTRAWGGAVWRSGLRTVGSARHTLLSLFGPLIVFTTLLAWLLMLWAGWVLLLSSDPNAISSTRGDEVTWAGRVWYVAYLLTTVGNGDFAPQEGLW